MPSDIGNGRVYLVQYTTIPRPEILVIYNIKSIIFAKISIAIEILAKIVGILSQEYFNILKYS